MSACAGLTPMLKSVCSYVAWLCVPVAIALISLLGRPYLGKVAWTLAILTCVVVGVIAKGVEIYLQHKEKVRADEAKKEADNRFDELFRSFEDVSRAAPRLMSQTTPLMETTRQLGHDIIAFLKEKGPGPQKQKWDKGISYEEHVRQVGNLVHPYIDSVHYGFQRRFAQKLNDLLAELRENGLDPEITRQEENPPYITANIRALAEKLLLLSVRLELDGKDKMSA